MVYNALVKNSASPYQQKGSHQSRSSFPMSHLKGKEVSKLCLSKQNISTCQSQKYKIFTTAHFYKQNGFSLFFNVHDWRGRCQVF